MRRCQAHGKSSVRGGSAVLLSPKFSQRETFAHAFVDDEIRKIRFHGFDC